MCARARATAGVLLVSTLCVFAGARTTAGVLLVRTLCVCGLARVIAGVLLVSFVCVLGPLLRLELLVSSVCVCWAHG